MKVIAVVLALCLGTSAQAKTYSGTEVEALMCAALLTVSGSVAYEFKMINETERNLMHVVAYAMLTRYVSGTDTQKRKAMEQLIQRQSFGRNMADLDRRGDACMKKFPPV